MKNFLCFLSCIVLWAPLTTTAAKKLVVFVGPHETGGTEVNKFFATHASSAAAKRQSTSSSSSSSSSSSPLNGWIWPTVEDTSPHHLFDLLVKEQNDNVIQSDLLVTIRKAYDESIHGVIIGSLWFDRVGTNPDTNYNAIKALNTVVSALEITPKDVVVAVTYRSPRLDQWASVAQKHFDFQSYQEFLCNEERHISNRRYEWLDTSMNPFYIAKTYYDVGYDIVMIDQEGTSDAGKDVAHVLACHVTDGQNCKNDWVNGLEQEKVELPLTVPISDLGTTNSSHLEELLRLRDCYYKTDLDSMSRFRILNSNITDCQAPLQTFYKQFADSDFLMNAIQSQKGCQTKAVDVPALLAQKDELVKKNSQDKRLVIFVGPHETHAEDVIKFFANYASTNKEVPLSPSFNGWLWPDIKTDIQAGSANHRIFDLLVADRDPETRNAILDAILENWHSAEKGLILGSILFDSVGKTPFSGFDGVAAVKSIVDKVGIDKNRVAVVVAHRSPKIDHWGVIWRRHFDGTSYKDFVCSDEHKDKRWEWLDSVVNPFQIAKSYFDEEYRVVVMDQKGIMDQGLDTAHAIACEILEGISCENGYVSGLSDVEIEPLRTETIDQLNKDEQADLEALFFGRDCYFSNILSGSHRFHILNDHGVWKKCFDDMADSYQALADTDVLMNAIQAQQGCEVFDVDIPTLVGRNPNTSTNTTSPGDSDGDSQSSEGSSNNGSENTNGGSDTQASGNGSNSDSGHNSASSSKKLVILAGPHETIATNITKFFAKYASLNSTTFSSSFKGWIWPTVDTESLGHHVPSYRVFDVLVRAEAEPETQDFFIKSIKDAWDTAEKGVIIGGTAFDKTGLNPYSGVDPLGVVRRLATALEVADENVQVVVNYRAPRIDQWSAVWNTHFDDLSYEEFVCSGEDKLKVHRWEWVDTAMNPMKIASAYAEQGWNTAVIDDYGVEHSGRDVAHIVSCDVLSGVKCDGGWVRGLKEERVYLPPVFTIDGLQYTDRNELEQAFVFRDCFFKSRLENNPAFEVYQQRKLWDSCPLEKQSIMAQLESTDFFVALLQSQKSCSSTSVDISAFLAGVDVDSQSTKPLAGLAIAVAVAAALVTCMACYLGVRRKRRAKKAVEDVSEGVFREDPFNGARVGPYPYRDDSNEIDPDAPYSAESSTQRSETAPSQNVFEKIRKSFQHPKAQPFSEERVGPYRDDGDGKSRERAYSGDDGDFCEVDVGSSTSKTSGDGRPENSGYEV